MDNNWRLPTIGELETLVKPQPDGFPQIDALGADREFVNDFLVNSKTETALDKNGLEWQIPAVGQSWNSELKTVSGVALTLSWADAGKAALEYTRLAERPGVTL